MTKYKVKTDFELNGVELVTGQYVEPDVFEALGQLQKNVSVVVEQEKDEVMVEVVAPVEEIKEETKTKK